MVREPGGTVDVDASGRLNGRGAYVCRDEACITNAVDHGLLGRALEQSIPSGLRERLLAAAATPSSIGGRLGQE